MVRIDVELVVEKSNGALWRGNLYGNPGQLKRGGLVSGRLYEEMGKPEEAADADGGLTALGEPDAAQ